MGLLRCAVIKGGLDPVEGTAVWKPSEEVPTATYQVRAYVVSSSAPSLSSKATPAETAAILPPRPQSR